jgi:hypothetical protein
MEEDRHKLMVAAEEEIAGIYGGGETECLRWLGETAALVTSTMAACQKLMQLAENRGRPFEEKMKIQLAFLAWYGQFVSMTGSLIESVGAMIESTTSEILPFVLLESMVGMYLAAHRVAAALWRERDETRLLWKDVPTTIN